MKRADEILARRQIDAGLAADRRIDHREQGRRHLHEGDAAHPAGRAETGEIADHAAAEREDRRIAARLHRRKRVEHARDRIESLVRLAVGQDQLCDM